MCSLEESLVIRFPNMGGEWVCVCGRMPDILLLFCFHRWNESCFVSTPSTMVNFYFSPCIYIYFFS